MEPYRVVYRPEVAADLKRIPGNVRKRIGRAIEGRLFTSPALYGERLAQSLLGLWRIRTGDYRIVYELDPVACLVTVWAIRHRKDVYPEMERRRR